MTRTEVPVLCPAKSTFADELMLCTRPAGHPGHHSWGGGSLYAEFGHDVGGEAAAKADPINHPAHYRLASGVEVIDLTEQLDFLRGNAVKYLARAGRKEGVDELEDLRKAQWYVNRAVENLERSRQAGA